MSEVLEVSCPKCHAVRGRECVRVFDQWAGHPMSVPHQERVEKWELPKLRSDNERLKRERDQLANVAKALLLFHRSGPWTLEMRAEWDRLTGREHYFDDVTSRSLCDFARAALALVGEDS